MQILFNLCLVFLTLQLSHLFGVFVLLAGEVVLLLLILGSCLLDVESEFLLLLFQLTVTVLVVNLLLD